MSAYHPASIHPACHVTAGYAVQGPAKTDPYESCKAAFNDVWEACLKQPDQSKDNLWWAIEKADSLGLQPDLTYTGHQVNVSSCPLQVYDSFGLILYQIHCCLGHCLLEIGWIYLFLAANALRSPCDTFLRASPP